MAETRFQQPQVDPEESRARINAMVIRILVFGFVLLMLGLLVVVVWVRPRNSGHDFKADARETGARDFKTLMQQGNEQQLKQFSIGLLVNLSGQALPAKIERLEQRIEIADFLAENSIAPELQDFAIISRLDSLLMLNEENLSNDLPGESVRQRLIELANAELKSDDSEICRRAHMVLLLMRVLDFNNDSVNYEACRQQIIDSSETMTKDLISARTFRRLVPLLQVGKDEVKKIELIKLIAEKLFASEIPEIKREGEEVSDDVLETKHKLRNLINELEFSTANWRARVEAFVSDFEGSRGQSSQLYGMALLLVESLLRIEEDELAFAYFDRLKIASENIEDEKRRAQVDEILDAFTIRRDSIGKPFLIDGNDVFGSPVRTEQFVGKVTTILIFSLKSNRSRFYLSNLNELKYLHDEGARFLCVDTEPDVLDQDKQLASDYPKIVWMNINDAPEMVERFPVLFTPYLIVLDKEGKVARINVGLDLLRNTILKLNQE